METEPITQNPTRIPIYAYTQHVATVRALEQLCYADTHTNVRLLTQDRSRDPVDDIMTQIPEREAILYAVLPVDKAVELRRRAPGIRLVLMQLDGRLIEQLTGQPYNPKQEYPPEVVLKALKTFEVRGGDVRTLTFEDLKNMLQGKSVAVFNDTMRQALQTLISGANFVKTCSNSDCIEVNPLGNKTGVRISFAGTVGQLDAAQMAELIRSGKARIYYAEIEATEVPPCLN